MTEAGDGEAAIGESELTFFADGKNPGAAEGLPQDTGEIKAAGELLFSGRPVGKEISLFIGMKGEDVPEKEIVRGEACFEAGFPDDGVGRLIESLFLLHRLQKRTVGTAGAPRRAGENHGAFDGRMEVEKHALTGHGNSGKVAALVAAGFGDEKVFCFSEPAGQIVRKLSGADGNSVRYLIGRIAVSPGIESKSSFVRGKTLKEG